MPRRVRDSPVSAASSGRDQPPPGVVLSGCGREGAPGVMSHAQIVAPQRLDPFARSRVYFTLELGTHSQTPHGGAMAEKILVADDERHIVDGLQMLLADDGFEVDTATDGKKAWDLVSGGGYGVVLADLRMPEMDGLELFRKMREAGIPSEMIIITGSASVDTAVQAMRQGAYDYLEKPLNVERLKALLPKALEAFRVKQANKQLEEKLKNLTRFGEMIGQS